MKIVLLITTVLIFSPAVRSARILALFGFSTQSHNNVFSALTKELAVRGHDLTVVTTYSLKNPPQNYRQIEISELRKVFSEQKDFAEYGVIKRLKTMYHGMMTSCPKILKTAEVKALLNERFDLILISVAMNDCCLPFVHHFKVPFIFLSPAGLFPFTSAAVGNPEPAAFAPILFLPYTDHMNFWQRSINFISGMLIQILHNFVLKPSMNAAAREFFGDGIPTIQELEVNASIVLINHHVSLNYPRPLNPNVIEVGGMQIKQKPDPLPNV
jgi:glucuronosyltransferase